MKFLWVNLCHASPPQSSLFPTFFSSFHNFSLQRSHTYGSNVMCRVPTVNTVGTVLYGDILSFSSCLTIHLCQSWHVDSFLLDYSLDLLNFPSHIVLLLTIADVFQCFWCDLTHIYHCRVFLFLFVLLTIPHISILLSCFRSLLCILWVRIELALSLTF